MNKHTDWALIIKYLSGECREEELETVETWISANHENKRFVELLSEVWNEPRQSVEEIDVKRMWEELSVKAEIDDDNLKVAPSVYKLNWKEHLFPKLNPVALRVLSYAAIIIIITLSFIISPVGFDVFNPGTKYEMLTISIEHGDKTEITLEDGSLVTLGAGSQFKYPEVFEEDEKHVYLTGEGFFEVKSDPDNPFYVHAGSAIVRVVGTRFNVRAWEIENLTKVTVSEGRVSLSTETDESSEVFIAGGEESCVGMSGSPSQPKVVDVEKALGWMENKIFFDNRPLNEILYHLSRIYNLEFTLVNPELGEEELTLYTESIPVNEILEMICMLTDSDYTIAGNNVKFSNK